MEFEFEKNFNEWNIRKQELDKRVEEILFHEREIWWCSLGVNIGFEEDGKNDLFERPVVVVKKFNRDVLWVLPLTHSDKLGRYYYPIAQTDEEREMADGKGSRVIVSQLRLISSNRLLRKMRMLPKEEFNAVVDRIKEFLFYAE